MKRKTKTRTKRNSVQQTNLANLFIKIKIPLVIPDNPDYRYGLSRGPVVQRSSQLNLCPLPFLWSCVAEWDMCILLIRDGEYPRSKDWQGDNVLAEGIKINR